MLEAYCKCPCTWEFSVQLNSVKSKILGWFSAWVISSSSVLYAFVHLFCFVMLFHIYKISFLVYTVYVITADSFGFGKNCFSVALVPKSFPIQKNLSLSKISNINKTWSVFMNKKKHIDVLRTLHYMLYQNLYLMLHEFPIVNACKYNTLHTLHPNFFWKVCIYKGLL